MFMQIPDNFLDSTNATCSEHGKYLEMEKIQDNEEEISTERG